MSVCASEYCGSVKTSWLYSLPTNEILNRSKIKKKKKNNNTGRVGSIPGCWLLVTLCVCGRNWSYKHNINEDWRRKKKKPSHTTRSITSTCCFMHCDVCYVHVDRNCYSFLACFIVAKKEKKSFVCIRLSCFCFFFISFNFNCILVASYCIARRFLADQFICFFISHGCMGDRVSATCLCMCGWKKEKNVCGAHISP